MRSRPPNVAGVPSGHDLAGGDHGDAVGQVLGLVHVVRGEEHGLAEVT
jgi:hypothetical protein